MPEYHATGHHLFQFEEDHRAAEVDFVPRFQPGPPRIAMNFAAHAVAYDPGAALGAALIKAVVEEAVLAGRAVVLNVRVLAGDGAIDVAVFHECQIVAAVQAAVLGGIGNIPGAMVGGLILGMAEVMAVGYGQSTYRDAIAFIILVLILLLKPSGMLGKGVNEKV